VGATVLQNGPNTVAYFPNNPPTGTVSFTNAKSIITGFISTPASYGVAVQCYEVGGSAYLVFNRMYGVTANISMDYSTSDGTAVAGVDYTAVSGTISWIAGDATAKVVRVPLLTTNKTINQFFNFHVNGAYITGSLFHSGIYIFLGGNINPFPGPDYGLNYTFPITIVRPGHGQADMVGTPYSVQRPVTTTTVTVQAQRFNSFRSAVSVNFHTTDGTATAGVDYTAASGTLNWADGEGGTKNMVITILNGGAGTMDFTVTIDTPTGGITIGGTPTATVNIVAAAPPPNPTPAGSVPDQLTDELAPYPNSFFFANNILADDILAFIRNNLLYQGMLTQKIGTVIGFGPAVGSFGQGTDATDQGQTLNAVIPLKYQGLVV